MKTNLRIGRVLLMGVCAIPLTGLSEEIFCPASITETPSVSAVDAAWTVQSVEGIRPLERVGIYFGDPSQRGAQVPDATRKIRSTEVVIWRLAEAPSDEYWVGCSYVGTTALMFQRVHSNVRECMATYRLLPTGRRLGLKSMTCK